MTFEHPRRILDVPYLETQDPAQRLDLYGVETVPRASSLRRPVVVWVHGGAWRHRTRRDEGARLAAFFDAAGYLFASVDHRYAPNPPDVSSDSALRHPTQVEDVAAAIAWLHSHAAEYGGDPSRLLLMGHSSGAHLVTLAAVHADYLRRAGVPRHVIRGVASLDVRAYDIPTLLADADPDVRLMYVNAFGDRPERWRDASPITHLSFTPPPMLVAVRGDAESRELKQAFAAALRRAGGVARLLDVSELSHADVRDALGVDGDSVVGPAVLAFFADVLEPNGNP